MNNFSELLIKNPYTEKDITVVVPSYNNLEYLKLLFKSVRDASKDVQLLIYADGCTDGTEEWFHSIKGEEAVNTYAFIQKERVGHTVLYDRGFQWSGTKVVGILHADMVIHKDFFKNILAGLDENTVVCGTCVEPPLHPPGGEKHIFDAGMYPHDFNVDAFTEFCLKLPVEPNRPGIFAPWFIVRETYLRLIGQHDLRFAPYGYEDCDLFARMFAAGLRLLQNRSAFVYHFTQRGHKWSKGIGIENLGYKEQMKHTQREYARKYGTDPRFDENHYPIPAPKYDVGFVVENSNPAILSLLEPYCSTIYVNEDKSNVDQYLQTERSVYNLRSRIKSLTADKTNDVLITFDANKLSRFTMEVLFNFPLIIQDTDDVGTFEYDIFTVNISQLKEVPHERSFIPMEESHRSSTD